MYYHPFLPRRWSSAAFLRWLKRVHAWTGLWGAAFFLLLGTSGVLLNHRQQLKIDTGHPVEVSRVELPVAAGRIADAEALGAWGTNVLRLPGVPQPPPGAQAPPAGQVEFAGRTVAPAQRWSRVFNLTDGKVTLEYVAGANHVTARREAVGALAVLKNLHKGTGLPVAWVLLFDTLAGALIVMSLTGVLLWSRLHGPRLLAAGIAAGALAWGVAAAAPVLA